MDIHEAILLVRGARLTQIYKVNLGLSSGESYKTLPAIKIEVLKKLTLFVISALLSCATSSHIHRQLSQLPPDKRHSYLVLKYSLEAVGDRDEVGKFDLIPSSDSLALKEFEREFWRKRDPNPFTPENEKKLEFDKRLEYVVHNFYVNNYFRPWDERGDVYLRFGEPTERKIEADREAWTYIHLNMFGHPLTFAFGYDFVRGYVSVPVPSTVGEREPHLKTTEIQQHMITWVSQVEHKPMQFFYDYGKEELKYAFGLTPFLMRDTPNIYDIYLTINAPAKKLVTPSLDSIHYVWKVLVQDENYERLFTDSSEGISYLGSVTELDKLIALDQKELRLKAGTYILTSELVNSTGNKGGMLQTQLTLPPYTFPKEIELSKVILAKEIRPADSTDFKFVRNGLVIKPWVSSIFNFDEPFWMYFEIYNMPQDREGKSHFTVKYYLQDLLTDKKYLLAEKSLWEAQRDFAMVQSFSDSLFHEAKVSLKTGKDYVILAEIKDEVMGKRVQSLSAMFKFKKSP